MNTLNAFVLNAKHFLSETLCFQKMEVFCCDFSMVQNIQTLNMSDCNKNWTVKFLNVWHVQKYQQLKFLVFNVILL